MSTGWENNYLANNSNCHRRSTFIPHESDLWYNVRLLTGYPGRMKSISLAERELMQYRPIPRAFSVSSDRTPFVPSKRIATSGEMSFDRLGWACAQYWILIRLRTSEHYTHIFPNRTVLGFGGILVSLVEPWFVFLRDVIEPKCSRWDQTSWIYHRSVPNQVEYWQYPKSAKSAW